MRRDWVACSCLFSGVFVTVNVSHWNAFFRHFCGFFFWLRGERLPGGG
jgi:hypothetical protein